MAEEPSPVVGLRRLLARAYSLSPGPGNPWPLFSTSLRSILFSKKTPFLLLFLLVPLGITFAISASLPKYTNSEYITSATHGRLWFHDIMDLVFFPLILPIVTAVYATGTIGDEVEGKTLPYLFTRPVYRSWILLAKAASFLTATCLLAILSVTITYFFAVGFTENPFNRIGELFGYWALIVLAVFAAGGAFVLLGVAMRRAIILIVFYTFLWETIINQGLPSNIRKYSFVFFERAFIAPIIDRKPNTLEQFAIAIPSQGAAVTTLLVLGVLGILGAFLVVSWRDYNV